MKQRIWRLLALFVVFAMVAASCGGSDDDSDSSGSADEAHSSEEEETGGVASQEDIDEALEADEEEEPEVTFDRSTIDGIWEEAAYNRQQMVEKITAKIDAGEWGIGDDNILRGPAGFEIDLNDCPDDWSNNKGITDTEIRIGHTTAMSGNLAAYGNLGVGWNAYLQAVNADGEPVRGAGGGGHSG